LACQEQAAEIAAAIVDKAEATGNIPAGALISTIAAEIAEIPTPLLLQ